jgi:hypothetical protein
MEKCSPVVQSTSMDILSKLKVPFPYIFIAYLVSKLLTYWFKYCFLNYLKTFNRNELPSARLHRPLSSTWLRKEIASKVVSHHTLPGAGYEIYNMPCLSLITRANLLTQLSFFQQVITIIFILLPTGRFHFGGITLANSWASGSGLPSQFQGCLSWTKERVNTST